MIAGAYGYEVPPVPIPNTEVKLIHAEDTQMVTSRENRAAPALIIFISYSSIAQSVERMTVNHDVAGSSPAWGAILDKSELVRRFGFVRILSRTSCVWIGCPSLSDNVL